MKDRSRGACGSVVDGVVSWIDSARGTKAVAGPNDRSVDWSRVAPLAFLHAGCLGILWVGWSWFAVATAFVLYVTRAFFLTAFYHRYFSHRTFKTSRIAQFTFALLGNTAAQRGPLWWAAHHRKHHRDADVPGDPHSPRNDGLYWSHMGWITARGNFPTDLGVVRDLAAYPELRWLDRFDGLVPTLFAGSLFVAGAVLESFAPGLGTTGPQLLVWGFFVSTVVLFHVTGLVNSAAHRIGRRRFATRDDSRNSLLVALVTLGEGWHNNHHHYPASTRQGFYWWEIDVTYQLLRLLAWLGLIWDMNPVPDRVLLAGRLGAAGSSTGSR